MPYTSGNLVCDLCKKKVRRLIKTLVKSKERYAIHWLCEGCEKDWGEKKNGKNLYRN